MRALTIDGPGSARVTEVDAPVPTAGQVVVDVHRAGICGTDAELFTGKLAYFAPGQSGAPLSATGWPRPGWGCASQGTRCSAAVPPRAARRGAATSARPVMRSG